MGWTSYHASNYRNGKVDRKAECDDYFMGGSNAGHFKVVKSAMYGGTYYGAVKPLVRYVGKDENGHGKYEPLPETEQEAFAVVFLTKVDNSDWFNFAYKDMDETMGPCYYDCPKSILDVLSPTDNEYAIEWRRKCMERIENKRRHKHERKIQLRNVQ